MVIVACFSSPALHRISAAAKTRHFLRVVLEGLNLLRTKQHLSQKHSPSQRLCRVIIQLIPQC